MTNRLHISRRAMCAAVLALAALPGALRAGAESYRTIYVKSTDGTKTGVTIAKNLVVQFPDWNTMKFAYLDQENWIVYEGFSISSEKFAGIELSADVSGVDAVADYTVTPVLAAGELRITGVAKPVTAVVCNASGMVLSTLVISADSTISLTGYGAGMYLVKIDDVTYKMLVK